ncbi:MAG: tRNA-dependent cyclodipeptide synthase [Candidatus Pacearchaeota archaeon]
MAMKIEETLNLGEEGIVPGKTNTFITICLGNKFFSDKTSIHEEIIDEYLEWAFKYTKDKVLFLIADKIQNTNYIVRNKNTTEWVNRRKVYYEGDRIEASLRKYVEKLPKEKQNKIRVIRWDEYERNDPDVCETTRLVYQEFKNNPEFRSKILDMVKSEVKDRKFKEEDYLKLCDYVLDEFPLCYHGLQYRGEEYRLSFYPQPDSVAYFLERIQNGEIFPKLKKRLSDNQVSWVILNEGQERLNIYYDFFHNTKSNKKQKLNE